MTAPDQHARFAALHGRAFPGTYAPAATLLARDEPIWVAVEDGELLGYVVLKLRPEHDEALVEYLAVAESARGRGIGTRLLTGALHQAFADDRLTRMDLVNNNPAARRLYEQVGSRCCTRCAASAPPAAREAAARSSPLSARSCRPA